MEDTDNRAFIIEALDAGIAVKDIALCIVLSTAKKGTTPAGYLKQLQAATKLIQQTFRSRFQNDKVDA